MNKYSATQVQQIKEIGQYLYQQRLKHSLSLEQLASLTFIRLAMLKALEGGHIEQLPELVYVQGFIRRYGEAVQLDGHALAQQITSSAEETPEISPDLVAPPVIEESLGQDAPPQVIHNQTPKKKTAAAIASQPKIAPDVSQESNEPSNNRLLKQLKLYWVYLLVLGGAIGGLFYLLGRPPASETAANHSSSQREQSAQIQPQEPPNPVTESNTVTKPDKLISSQTPSPILESASESTRENVNPVPSPSIARTATSETLQSSPQPEAITETAPISETPESNTTETAPLTGPVKATVNLENDSWLKVEVDGKTEYEGILEQGSQQAWTAQENLVIRAGNAGAVNLSVNNQPPQLLGELGEVKEITITPDG